MIWLACGYVVLHLLAIALFPASAMAVSYVFLIAAPVLAAAAMLRRRATEGHGYGKGWGMLAVALILWALGMFSSMSQDLLLGIPPWRRPTRCCCTRCTACL